MCSSHLFLFPRCLLRETRTRTKLIMNNNRQESIIDKWVYFLHSKFVSESRSIAISNLIIRMLPRTDNSDGLDVGCGSGAIARMIMQKMPKVNITGLDIIRRNKIFINVMEFDGKKIPFQDKSFDFCLLVNLLHHTDNQLDLLNECARVSRKYIFIIDHICESRLDRIRLSLMDWVGNLGYQASLQRNYLSKNGWDKLFSLANLRCEEKVGSLCIYPNSFCFIFNGKLHFVARLIKV